MSWNHLDCEHPVEQLVTVLIQRPGYESVLLVGPAIGPYLGP